MSLHETRAGLVRVLQTARMTHTPNEHHAAAVRHLEAVQATRLHLDGLYASPAASRLEIAAAHDQIRHGLKLADLHAALAVTCDARCSYAARNLAGVPA